MVTAPSSLVAKVFTARYCRNDDLLTAGVHSNASFVWRSLVWSREVLEKGLGWRVGDGREISVYKDKWVMGLEGSLRSYGEVVHGEDMKVHNLLASGGGWDVEKIEGLFSPQMQQGILNTPIREAGPRDQRRWIFEEKGRFTVKSAYLAEIGFYEQHPHASTPDRKRWSRLVWNVSIPPKARVFLWRAFNHLIPTAANLKMHHVPTSGICSLCGARWGSTEHSLIQCPKIKRVWKESRFEEVLKKANGLMLMEVAETAGQLGVVLGAKKWKRPGRGRLRVDVDAHFDPAHRGFGVGVVVRDANGRLKAALAKKSSPSSNAMMAEIMAVVHAIVLCVEHEFAPVEIYTDSILAARVMADPDEEDQLLPEDICDILRRARESILIGVYHMYRSANLAAHSLAKIAVNCVQSSCWTADFPSWLRDIVSEDLS